MLARGPNSARTFTSNKEQPSRKTWRPFRMPSNPIHVGLAENLGASAEVIRSVSSSAAGGRCGRQRDNGMVTVVSEGLYEVQKYVYETNHIIATTEILANGGFMSKLTEEQHSRSIKDAAKATAEQAWADYAPASTRIARSSKEERPPTVTPVSKAIVQKLMDMTQPVVVDKLLAGNDWAQELTDEIRAVK